MAAVRQASINPARALGLPAAGCPEALPILWCWTQTSRWRA